MRSRRARGCPLRRQRPLPAARPPRWAGMDPPSPQPRPRPPGARTLGANFEDGRLRARARRTPPSGCPRVRRPRGALAGRRRLRSTPCRVFFYGRDARPSRRRRPDDPSPGATRSRRRAARGACRRSRRCGHDAPAAPAPAPRPTRPARIPRPKPRAVDDARSSSAETGAVRFPPRAVDADAPPPPPPSPPAEKTTCPITAAPRSD